MFFSSGDPVPSHDMFDHLGMSELMGLHPLTNPGWWFETFLFFHILGIISFIIIRLIYFSGCSTIRIYQPRESHGRRAQVLQRIGWVSRTSLVSTRAGSPSRGGAPWRASATCDMALGGFKMFACDFSVVWVSYLRHPMSQLSIIFLWYAYYIAIPKICDIRESDLGASYINGFKLPCFDCVKVLSPSGFHKWDMCTSTPLLNSIATTWRKIRFHIFVENSHCLIALSTISTSVFIGHAPFDLSLFG